MRGDEYLLVAGRGTQNAQADKTADNLTSYNENGTVMLTPSL